MGLEDGGEEVGGGGGFGLALEGSLLLYAVVLGVPGVACYGAYSHFSM